MIKQCSFAIDEVGRARILRGWPLESWGVLHAAVAEIAFEVVYVAVESSVWRDKIAPPPAHAIPGCGCGKRILKKLSRRQLLTFLADAERVPSVDLLVFAPEKHCMRGEEHLGFLEECFEDSRQRMGEALRRYDGFWLHFHDGELATLVTNHDSICRSFYNRCAEELANGVAPSDVKKTWKALKACGKGRCLLLCGYNQTLYFRHAPIATLQYADFREFFRWDLRSGGTYIAGPYGADLRRVIRSSSHRNCDRLHDGDTVGPRGRAKLRGAR